MDNIIGLILLSGSIFIILITVFWSHRIIELIHKEKLKSAREILKKINEKK